MAILVVAEHDNKTLNDSTRAAVTAAAKMGGDIDILVAGSGAGAVAEAASKIAGVRKVLHADGESLAHPIAEALAALIEREEIIAAKHGS